MATLDDTPEAFNVIPIPRNSKIPVFRWQKYQKEKYPKNKLLKDNGNYAVICGDNSNNLLVLDIDLKEKEYWEIIYNEFKNNLPELVKTKIVSTPHGFHIYYYMNDFTEERHPIKNAGYNKKLAFSGTTKTHFSQYLKGFDILGNNGYAIIPPSRVDNLTYKCFNNERVRHITKEEYQQIRDLFILEKPKRMRKPFIDILNGKIDIEDHASTTGKKEFIYWKYLFREAFHYCNLIPSELYKGLEKNQNSFDIEETEKQLEYHDFKEKPLTNDKLKEYFPDYKIPKTKKKDLEKPKQKTIKDLIKEDSEEVKVFAKKFNSLPAKEKVEQIDKILKFYIAGEKKTRKLVYFLLLSNYKEELRTCVIIRSSSSAGKNHLVTTQLKLFPDRSFEQYSSATASVFNYEDLSDRKFLYLREMREGENSEEIFKSMVDGDRIHKEVVRIKGRNAVVDHFLASLGIITTLSFESVQIDLINRAWVIVMDESIAQTKRISRFKLLARKNVIERDIKKEKICKEARSISESYKYLNWNYKVIIPYIDKLKDLIPENPKINFRRDDDKLYDLIEIVSIFNQKNRKSVKIGNKEYLLAQFVDLEIALDMAQDLYIDLILHIDEIKRDIIEAFTESKPVWTITKMYQLLDKKAGSRKTVERKMFDLSSEGYLNKKKKGTTWQFKKLRNIDFMGSLNLEDLREEIDNLVEQSFIYYSNKTKEMLEEE